MTAVFPHDDTEQTLLETHTYVAGIDEVGRGALAGPVCIGLTVLSKECGKAPGGIRDSKDLRPAKRAELAPLIRQWVQDWAVGWASAQEIDAYGIVGGLRLATWRALQEVEGRGHLPQVVILDGSHDYLSPPADALFGDFPVSVCAPPSAMPKVLTEVKADQRIQLVAGASVIAKVARDTYMEELQDPGYDWKSNKGYASARHVQGLKTLGVSEIHRRSWKLPGIVPTNLA
ncbi:MAG: ribonuclease HII [Actinomycetaceae bacterium]|nr:ribonuclease HII [Actinomycetaceae bacterium]